MTIIQLKNFLKNNDTSSINFRRFNSAPRDKYPTFTICFVNNVVGIFDADYLNSTFGISVSDYHDALSGINDNETEMEMISAVDFNKATVKLMDSLIMFKSDDNKKGFRILWPQNKLLSNEPPLEPLYLSERTQDRLCYTRTDKFELGVNKIIEVVQFNLTYLNKIISHLEVYAHYPGHFLRSGLHMIWLPVHILNGENNDISITLSQVNVIRKRPDANVPCDPALDDDDHKFRQTVVQIVGCVPPYWMALFARNNFLPVCKSSVQLKKIKEFHWFDQRDNVTNLYDPPCDEMSLDKSYITQPYDRSVLVFWINYPSRTYQEIKNEKAFGFEMLWSSVGGFVGIFLGYSLMQVPSLLAKFVALAIRKYRIIRYNEDNSNV